VPWKLDDGPVQRSIWGVTGRSAPGSPQVGPTSLAQGGSSAMDWLRRVAAGKKLIVRVPDHHGGQETSFELAGLGTILDHVSQMPCGK
jgi:hypothetical protein